MYEFRSKTKSITFGNRSAETDTVGFEEIYGNGREVDLLPLG